MNNNSVISKFSITLRPDPNRTKSFQYTYDKKFLQKIIEQNSQFNLDNQQELQGLSGKENFHTFNNYNKQPVHVIPPDIINFKSQILLFFSITINNDSDGEITKLQDTLRALETNYSIIFKRIRHLFI